MRHVLLRCTILFALACSAHAAPARFSDDARQLAGWVQQSNDNAGLPYALVDKKAAMLYLFGADGQLRAASPALLGAAPGDRGAPGLNQRDLSTLAFHERTTPAGRYVAQPGRNLQGEPVVWVDYGAALAIHRLRPGPAAERRAGRLRSATPADNRISLGCVVVPVAFYEQQVAPLLGQGRSVVYILPETLAASEVFGWQ
ncbi:MAG: L,D-transpeptidase [Pseudorhodoferax sp.]